MSSRRGAHGAHCPAWNGITCMSPFAPTKLSAAGSIRLTDDEWTDLGALVAQQYADPGGRLRNWTHAFVYSNPTDTLSLLKDLSAGISTWITYESRDDEGTLGRAAIDGRVQTQPPSGGRTGKIVMTSNRTSYDDCYVANADGSEPRQVTRLGAASFAPAFFPAGDRIIFSSNYGDPKGREFELWAVNLDGSGLERITWTPGFDGFPLFSPDGTRLAFASNRNQSAPGETNVFVARWMDGGASGAESRFREDVAWLAHAARRADHVVITQKDAVKLRDRWPNAAPEPLVAVLDLEWEEGGEEIAAALDAVVTPIDRL